MKTRLLPAAIAAIALIGLASCDGNSGGSDNDPAVAAGLLATVTPMCAVNMTSPAMTISGTASFAGSVYEGDAAPNNKVKVTFSGYKVTYEGKAYTIDGAINLAYAPVASVANPGGGFTLNVTNYVYTSGLTISGPDFDSTISSDCRIVGSLAMALNGSQYSLSISATVDGFIAGKSFASSSISGGGSV